MNLAIQIKEGYEPAALELKSPGRRFDWTFKHDQASDPLTLWSRGDASAPSVTAQVPQEMIEVVTLSDQISRGIRSDGVYILGDNRITLCSFPGGQNFRGTGTTVAGLQELYRLIRTGQMQPTENWEAPIQSAPVTVTRI